MKKGQKSVTARNEMESRKCVTIFFVCQAKHTSHVIVIRYVEAVQHRFTKILLGMDQLPYAERLMQLGLQLHWNSLPDFVVTATSKSSFKRSLFKVNLQSYISQPRIMT